MKSIASVGPPLRIFALLLASSAHALPSRLRGGGIVPDPVADESDQAPLPPSPSDRLIDEMNSHNAAFEYEYTFWNETDLDAEGCSQLAERRNRETASSQEEELCIPHYSCNFNRLRYPHWAVYTSCSKGTGRCTPCEREGDYRCFAHQVDVVMLQYEEVSRSIPGEGEAGEDLSTARSDEDKPVSRQKGEWQLRFVQVPSECNCYL